MNFMDFIKDGLAFVRLVTLLLAAQRQMLDIAQQCQARSGTPANEPR